MSNLLKPESLSASASKQWDRRQAQAANYSAFDKYAGFYFMSNLQGLCAKCHSVKTTEDKQHVGPWPDVVAKERAQPKKVYSF
jgi:hypothetical protein